MRGLSYSFLLMATVFQAMKPFKASDATNAFVVHNMIIPVFSMKGVAQTNRGAEYVTCV